MTKKLMAIVFGAFLTLSVAGFNSGISAQVSAPVKSTVVGRILNSGGSPAVAIGVGVLLSENPQCVPATHGVQTSRGSFSSLAAYGMTDGAGRYRLEIFRLDAIIWRPEHSLCRRRGQRHAMPRPDTQATLCSQPTIPTLQTSQWLLSWLSPQGIPRCRIYVCQPDRDRVSESVAESLERQSSAPVPG